MTALSLLLILDDISIITNNEMLVGKVKPHKSSFSPDSNLRASNADFLSIFFFPLEYFSELIFLSLATQLFTFSQNLTGEKLFFFWGF